MKIKRSIKKAAALLLLLSLLSTLLCSCFFGTPTVASREEIEQRLTELEGEDLGYKYVSSYLEEYGIGLFDGRKFRRAELYIYSYFAYEMPAIHEMGANSARLFLEYFYDEIDLTDEDKVTDALLHCYVASLGDRYAVYRNASESDDYHTDMSGSFVGIGVVVQYPEEGVIEIIEIKKGSPAEEAGIKVGDRIVAVDGKRVAEVGTDTAVNMIRGEEGTEVLVTVSREGEELTLTATRARVTEELVSYSISKEKLGYIKINSFRGLPDDPSTTASQFKEAISYMKEEGARGIIFDLRDNPGGYLSSVIEVLECFVPRGTPIVSYAYSGELPTVISAEDDDRLTLPVAVICNGGTASAGELFTAALRDYGKMGLLPSVTVGTTTYGKGVMQSEFDLTESSTLTFTTAFYNPPSGENYDGVGIIPDAKEELIEGEGDRQLMRAMLELEALISGYGKTE